MDCCFCFLGLSRICEPHSGLAFRLPHSSLIARHCRWTSFNHHLSSWLQRLQQSVIWLLICWFYMLPLRQSCPALSLGWVGIACQSVAGWGGCGLSLRLCAAHWTESSRASMLCLRLLGATPRLSLYDRSKQPAKMHWHRTEGLRCLSLCKRCQW